MSAPAAELTWRYARLVRGDAGESSSRPLLDLAIAVLVFAISLGLLEAGLSAEPGGGDMSAAAIALTALTALPLVMRRRAPLAVFALTGVAGVALRLVAAPIGPPLGALVALSGIVAEEPRRPSAAYPLIGAVIAAYLTATAIGDEAARNRELALAVVGFGAAWMVGELTRARTQRIAALERRAQDAERAARRERRLAIVEERMRIARDLHDSAGHALGVILVHAGAGRLAAERDPAATRSALATIEEVARDTVVEIEQLVGALREDGDQEPDAPAGIAALDGLLARHRAAGLDVNATTIGTPRPLPTGVDHGAYRILQEALTNAARYGDGRALVELTFGERGVELAIVNRLGVADGNGSGHGIVGMRERAALLGGSLRAERSGGDFEVRAWLPTNR